MFILYHNKLKIIDSKTFKNINKIDVLYLDNSEIEEIFVRLFESLSNLKMLYLYNNKPNRKKSNFSLNLNLTPIEKKL